MKRLFLTLLSVVVIMVAAFVAVPLHAQAPVLPHAFFGSIVINGSSAPVGTQIEARGANVLSGIESNPLTVAEAGRYGGSGAFAVKLIVQGNKIANDTPISFYVDGTKAECAVRGGVWQSSYPFRSGVVTELLLRVGGSSGSTRTPTSLPTTRPTVTPIKTALPSLTSTPTSLPTTEPTARPTKTAVPRPTVTRATQAMTEGRPTEASAATIPTTAPTAQGSTAEPTVTPSPLAAVLATTPVPRASSTIIAQPAQELAPAGTGDTPTPAAVANLETPVSVRSAPAGASPLTPAAEARQPASGTKPILRPTTRAPESQRVAGSEAGDVAPVRVALWLGLAALALAGLGIPVLIFFVRRR